MADTNSPSVPASGELAPVSDLPGGSGAGDGAAADVAAAASTSSAATSLREEQIQNAVAFLTHPKVRESPTATKRSFLERKGLTAAEIDEAFRRVPQPSQTPAASPVPASSPGAPAGLITYQQPQQTPAHSTPATAAPQATGGQSGVAGYHPVHPTGAIIAAGHPQGTLATIQPPEPLRWTQVLLGVGVVAAGVYAVRTVLVPRMADWYRSWADRSKEQRELALKQAAALQDTVDALKACQVEIKGNSEAVASLVASIKEQQASMQAREARERSAAQRTEAHLDDVRHMLREIQAVSAQTSGTRSSHYTGVGPAGSATKGFGSAIGEERGQMYSTGQDTNTYTYYSNTNGKGNGWTPGVHKTGSSPTPPVNSYPLPGVHPWRTEQPPPYGQEPHGQLSSGTATPAASGDVASPGAPATDSRPAGTAQSKGEQTGGNEAPYPPSFHEVMEMVQKGITPPNVRTDIVDTPPDPSRPLPQPAARSQPKPWERGPASSSPPPPVAAHQPPAESPYPPYGASNGALPGGQRPWAPQPALWQSWTPDLDAGRDSTSMPAPQQAPGASQTGEGPGTTGVTTQLLSEQQQFAQPTGSASAGAAGEGTSEGSKPVGRPAWGMPGAGGGMYSSIFGGVPVRGPPVTLLQSGGAAGASTWRPPPPPTPTLPRNKSSGSVASSTGVLPPAPSSANGSGGADGGAVESAAQQPDVAT